MNINELDSDIAEHKQRLGKNYNDILETTLPFYMFHQKLLSGVSKLQSTKYNLGNSEVDVLVTTMVSGDSEYKITPTKLYEKLLFTSGGITKVLNKLEDRGYISRVANDFDKRSKLVKLTKEGKKICEKVLKDILDYEVKVFSILTKEELENFKNTIIKLAKEM
jgi:DNA-binding MarR family transcriptional regulator